MKTIITVIITIFYSVWQSRSNAGKIAEYFKNMKPTAGLFPPQN